MLDCKVCSLTQHHCCKASIAFNVMEVLCLSQKADELGIKIKILSSKEKPNYFNIIKKGKPIKSLNDENCIFLINGLCSIYEERPAICRIYGTETVKCWFHDLAFNTPANEIFDMTEEEIQKLTSSIISENEKTVLKLFKEKMK